MSCDAKTSSDCKLPQTGAGHTVAVTGASGYIAGVLIRMLLQRGYTVHGTVRSLANAEKVKHLLEDFPGIKLFEADLLQEGSFKTCFEGCDIIFHTASPFQHVVEDPERDLLKPALLGTVNVMTEALKTPTVKRIVLTSSIASIRNTSQPPEHLFTEKDWNTTSTLATEPYPYSKVVAEKKAWEMVEEHQKQGGNIDMITICPSSVLGPPMSSRTDSFSINMIVNMLNGVDQKGVVPTRFPSCDVDDVALAHVLAAENKNASGRYIISSLEPTSRLQMCNVLRKWFPGYPVPTKSSSENYNRVYLMDSTRAEKELGVPYTPYEESIKRMGEALIKFGVIKTPTSSSQLHTTSS